MTLSSQNLVFLARADTCIQGEGRHNIFVLLEVANQLRGDGAKREGREGRNTIWPGNTLELPAVHLGFRGQLEGILFRAFVQAACRTSVRKRGRKRPLGQCRWRWDSNVKLNVRERRPRKWAYVTYGLTDLDTYVKSEELLTIWATVIFWRRTLVFGTRWNLWAFEQSLYGNKNR